jgi:hypothetical protein
MLQGCGTGELEMVNEKRLIDANALMELARNHIDGIVDCNDIARFPRVDAVEVVRCKDCKHLEITGCYGECRKLVRIVKPWDFCSYGERREGE